MSLFIVISTIYDTKNFLSTLTIRKCINYLRLRASYIISLITRSVFFQGNPASLSIEPTTSCNLRCPECPSGLRKFSRKTGMIEMPVFKSTIDQAYKDLIYLLLYFQGEPYLHPDFFEMVKYARKKNIYTATSTNGHYLDYQNAEKTVLSGLNRLIISIDGTSQESYAKYRAGGSFEKVIEGTRNLLKAKRKLKSNTPFIVFQMVVFRSNEHEVKEMKQLGKALGVDKIQIKSAQFYNLNPENDLIPTEKKYLRYTKKQGKHIIKSSIPNKCWRSWHNPVVTIDGKLVPCCFDKDAAYEMGDLKEQSLNSVFNGTKINAFRNGILTNRKQYLICSNCTEGIKVFR